MLSREILLAFVGLSAGAVVSGGLFSFIVSLGIVSDFADRTHTGAQVLLYEDAIILGGILGSIFLTYEIRIPNGGWILAPYGLFTGIFSGAWAMALAEILNIFPIFIRRLKIVQAIPYIIVSVAIGKGIGAFFFFFFNW